MVNVKGVVNIELWILDRLHFPLALILGHFIATLQASTLQQC